MGNAEFFLLWGSVWIAAAINDAVGFRVFSVIMGIILSSYGIVLVLTK